jgi:hypothetical protein
MRNHFAGGAALLLATLLGASPSSAHWCSNIWAGPSRLVVKPEKSTVYVSSAPTQLKVYLQNNFPYTLFGAKMRGKATAYTVTVNPASQDVQPGQNVLFTLTITSSTGSGSVPVSSLDIQVWMRYALGQDNGFRGADDPLVNQSPSQDFLVNARGYLAKDGYDSPGQQAPSLSMATLFDKYPQATLPAGPPFFGRTGVQQLIHWFGYRFCYFAEGGWGCGTQDCPSPCPEGSAWTSNMEFSSNGLRAGLDLAIRKSKLGSELVPARNAAINAIKGGGEEFKCLAAIVGAVLWQGAASAKPFEDALASSPVSARCKAAALRALGKGQVGDCAASPYWEQATCAAAEGLQRNDGPVKTYLLPNAGDGKNPQTGSGTWQENEFYAYMLYLVTGDNYARNIYPSYYPNVGGIVFPDAGGVTPDTQEPAFDYSAPANDQGQIKADKGSTDTGGGGCSFLPTPAGGGVPLFLVALLVFRRRAR